MVKVGVLLYLFAFAIASREVLQIPADSLNWLDGDHRDLWSVSGGVPMLPWKAILALSDDL